MSWLIGGLTAGPAERLGLERLHPAPLHRVEAPGFYLAAGGLPETCRMAATATGEAGWVVVGLGIRTHTDHSAWLEEADWEAVLAADRPVVEELDGQFLALRWQGGIVEAFNDPLGLRTLHAARVPGGVVFATRVDWLARSMERAELDWAAFGARWLGAGEHPADSLLRGAHRLGQGGRARLSSGEVEMEEQAWQPGRAANEHAFAGALRALTRLRLPEGWTWGVGMSGGIDSRLLLALLQAHAETSWTTFVNGPADHPDARVAAAIADGEGHPHRHLRDPLPEPAVLLDQLAAYAAQTTAFAPVQAYEHHRHLPGLYGRKEVLVEGALAEAARGKLVLPMRPALRRALESEDPGKIAAYLRKPKAAVFAPEIVREMEVGGERQVERVLGELPPVGRIGAKAWLNRYGIRIVVPRFGGSPMPYAQAATPVHLPFGQPAVLETVTRRVGETGEDPSFRRMIRELAPNLARYPLVRDYAPVVTYPFGLPPGWVPYGARLKRLAGRAYRDASAAAFLEHLAGPVRDLAHSASVGTFGAYDAGAVRDLVDGFYGGERRLASEVGWWLTFELWRRALEAR